MSLILQQEIINCSQIKKKRKSPVQTYITPFSLYWKRTWTLTLCLHYGLSAIKVCFSSFTFFVNKQEVTGCCVDCSESLLSLSKYLHVTHLALQWTGCALRAFELWPFVPSRPTTVQRNQGKRFCPQRHLCSVGRYLCSRIVCEQTIRADCDVRLGTWQINCGACFVLC